jgi:hypothetical protein
MATTKVSELSALTTTDGAEELLINDGGTSKKVTIANLLVDDQVTYAKIQNVSADERILGRVSGADGVIEELTKTQVLTFANVEDGADVTDATNVAAAGALMDSELAGIAAVKATTGTFLTADQTKLDGIETSADVTDATNVTAAGALMDSEVTNLAEVKAFAASDYATAAQGTLATNALPKAGGAMTGAITTNSTFDGRDVATDGTKLDGIAASSNNYVHPNHSGDVTSTADGATVIAAGAVDIAMMSATGTASSSTYLRGDNAWSTVDALPSQTGHAGKYLTTNASAASWATLDTDANTTTKGLYEHEHTIDADYSITSGNNAISASPITISSGYSVTVPTGSTWVIV